MKRKPPRVSDSARRLAALRIIDPKEWRESVRKALCKCGTIPDAAASLGVAPRTLAGWLMDDATLSSGIELRGRGRPPLPPTPARREDEER